MRVLVLNAGSSSLKFNLFEMSDETSLLEGLAERIGVDGRITWSHDGESGVEETPLPDHTAALHATMALLEARAGHGKIHADSISKGSRLSGIRRLGARLSRSLRKKGCSQSVPGPA